jgi:DNA repair exonuclease SbcCD ATPase subunit
MENNEPTYLQQAAAIKLDDTLLEDQVKEIAKLKAQLAGCKEEIFRRITSEYHQMRRAERLEELYKSACQISEQRRQELATARDALQKISDIKAVTQAQKIAELEDRLQHAEEALREIGEHPHCNPKEPPVCRMPISPLHGAGMFDGHRCADASKTKGGE